MTFSVVIPMYNAAATIKGTIDSCLLQSIAPLEVIVVDDCSTDNSCDVVLQNYGNQVKILRLPENSGPSTARNKGWDAAQGDYVAFVDSDDMFHLKKLEICKAIFEKNPNIGLLWHPFQTTTLPNYNVNDLPKPEVTTIVSLLPTNKVSSSAIVFNRNISLRFREDMRYCEDYQIAFESAYQLEMMQLPMILTQIGRPVLSKGGLSQHLIKMRAGEIKAYFLLGKLNPLFYLLFPFLLVWSFAKLIVTVLKSE